MCLEPVDGSAACPVTGGGCDAGCLAKDAMPKAIAIAEQSNGKGLLMLTVSLPPQNCNPYSEARFMTIP